MIENKLLFTKMSTKQLYTQTLVEITYFMFIAHLNQQIQFSA